MPPRSERLTLKKKEEAKDGRGSRILFMVLLALSVILLMVDTYEIPLEASLLNVSLPKPNQNVAEEDVSKVLEELDPMVTSFGTSSLSAKTVSQRIVDKWTNRVDDLAQSLATKLGANPLPSVKNTFVFFHMRKGGGSTLRSIITNSSIRHNLTSWIPCKNTNCTPFSLPPAGTTGYMVYASHLNYAHMSQVIREQRPHPNSLPTGRTNQTIKDHNVTYLSVAEDYNFRRTFGSCLTNLRPTVSRVVSCWNYRFVKESKSKKNNCNWTIPMASEAMAEDWNTLLPDALDTHGNGCNNEIVRAFGRTQDESFVNHFSVESVGPRYFVDELETIMERMATCVVIRVDKCAESQTIMKHYLPWIDAEEMCSIFDKESDLPKTLREGAEEVILSQNAADDLAFSFGEALFEAQLRVARIA